MKNKLLVFLSLSAILLSGLMLAPILQQPSEARAANSFFDVFIEIDGVQGSSTHVNAMDILKSKIKLIADYLPQLQDTIPNLFDEFQNNILVRSASERYFQIIVDSIVDCNQIIIEQNNLEVSETYLKTFNNLMGKSIFPDDLLKKLADCVSTRNAIIHKYENIQLKREYEDMRKFIPLMGEYLKFISNKYL